MKHQLLIAALIASTGAMTAASTSDAARRFQLDHFRLMPEATASRTHAGGELPAPAESRISVKSASEIEANRLPAGDNAGWLDGPKGDSYYYVVNYRYDEIQHESWTERLVNGYTITIYDPEFNVAGTIDDDVAPREGETKIAQVAVGPQLTRKFYNYDDKIEVMVAIAANTPDYVNTYRTLVYSLGVEEPIAEIEGTYVSAIDTATDQWGEHYWITFLTEEESETPEIDGLPNAMDYVFRTYRYAGYGGIGDPVLTSRLPVMLMAGENMTPFLASKKDGNPCFALISWEKCWYEEPWNFENDNPAPDNNLVVKLYTLPNAYSSQPELYSTTKIPNEATIDDLFFLYVGNFSYDRDISFTDYSEGDGVPGLVVTREHYIPGNDGYLYDFIVYSGAPEGETAVATRRQSLAEGVAGGYFMADIEGVDPQIMYIVPAGDAYSFEFRNPVSGEMQLTLPAQITPEISVTASTDRVAHGDSYLLYIPQTMGYADEESNIFTDVAYVTPEGEIDHIDSLALGQNVDYAMVYDGADGLDPYLFNLDDSREYMVLVKRRDNPDAAGNHEELLVLSANPEKAPLLQLLPDEELGALGNISLVNLDGALPSMVVLYANDYRYTAVTYPLPLQGYEAGDGSAENPYQINTLGGLKLMKAYPSAHFALTSDIDCAGTTLAPQSWTFGGSLEGNGHVIYDLHLRDRALFPAVAGSDSDDKAGRINGINFVRPVLEATVDGQGVVAGMMMNAEISDVHLYEASVTGSGTVAGIAGEACLYSSIKGSSMLGDIESTQGSAAGIVGGTRTTSSVRACAFRGTLKGVSEVGGIAGYLGNAADSIADCHVVADITAHNTVGGVAGSSNRAVIERCHLEGSIEATEASRWGGGPRLGGVVGALSEYISESGDPADQPIVIRSCYVDVYDLIDSTEKGEEAYPGQNDTAHRIVGYSQANAEPEVTGYDSDYNPIYGEPMAPEGGLADNYAIFVLTPFDTTSPLTADCTEGATKVWADCEDGRDFFEYLGYKAGYDVDAPWNPNGFWEMPSLWFEGGLLVAAPSDFEVNLEETVPVAVTLIGANLTEFMFDRFTIDIEDESIACGGEMSYDAGTVTVEIKGLSEGRTKITFEVDGKTTDAYVTVRKPSGIDSAIDGTPELRVNGDSVEAEGCMIEIYSISGLRVVSGQGQCSLSALPEGIYILTATAPDGTRTTRKYSRR